MHYYFKYAITYLKVILKRKNMKKILTISMLILLSACAGKKDKTAEVTMSDEEINKIATDEMELGHYTKAANLYSKLVQEHPYSALANNAQLMEAVASYKAQKFDEAAVAFDAYITFYPGDEELDYAYYMKALCYYDQLDDVRLDKTIADNARDALNDLINRFPNSKYSQDAKLKLNLVNNFLAAKEMYIGRFYLKQKEYTAAIPRFQKVASEYQTTNFIEEALYRLTESYLILGLRDEALINASILGNNYPASKWYKRAYALLNKHGLRK